MRKAKPFHPDIIIFQGKRIRMTPQRAALLAKIEYIHYNYPRRPIEEAIKKAEGYS